MSLFKNNLHLFTFLKCQKANKEIMEEIVVPQVILNEAENIVSNLLPEKSRSVYEKEYYLFCDWRKLKNVKGVSEEVLLAYFSEKSKKVKASSLWSYYSMLKATLVIKENINISKFPKLLALLKKQTTGYKPKKSRIFERDDINKFLTEAPDEQYLFMKVVAIMGVAGGCRIDELHKMQIDHINDRGSVLIINIPDTKTKKERTFTVIGEGCEINNLEIVRKYWNLRPPNVSHKNFFICYRAQKCTVQPVGINTLSKVPKMITQYLNLPNNELYTGHCFRRSLASLLANAGADFLTIKRHGGWRSSFVVEGYIDESINNKIAVSRKILVGIESNNAVLGHSDSEQKRTILNNEDITIPGVHFNNIQNSTVNIYINSDSQSKKVDD